EEEFDRHPVGILGLQEAAHAPRTRDVIPAGRDLDTGPSQVGVQAVHRGLILKLESDIEDVVLRSRMKDKTLREIVRTQCQASVRMPSRNDQAEHIDEQAFPAGKVTHLEANVAEA